jgi:ATP-binding cassette subfamily B protein
MQRAESIIQLINRLWRHLSPRRHKQFGLLLTLMICTSFAEIISIGAVFPFLGALTSPTRIFEHSSAQPFIQILGINSAEKLLLPLTIAFGIAALMAGTLRFSLLWVTMRLTFAVGVDLSISVYRRTLYQPYPIHISRNSSEVINGITAKTSEVIFYILMQSLIFINAVVMLIIIGTALLYIIPGLAFAAFGGFGIVYAIIIFISRKRLKINSQRIARESTHVVQLLQEGLGGIRDVLIDGSQEAFCDAYRGAEQILRRAQGNNQIASYGPRYAMEAMAMLLIATLAYLLSQEPHGIAAAIPLLAALAIGMQRLLPALQQLYGAWSIIHGAQASLYDTLELLDQPMPNHVEHPQIKPIPFLRQISLNKLSFRYSEETPWVLKDINLVIPKGSRIGFIGATGSGKSTLLDVIMGLFSPTAGTVEIDDRAVTEGNVRAWQTKIAHVPQAIFLSDNSVAENIAFGVPKDNIDYRRVSEAARQAQLAEVIETWPEKYQTPVGERGIQLSGGQRQRIGIARALYKKADVIIFDESTSALDTATEQSVMAAIESLSKDITILIIAHRLTTLHNCTQIVEIENGSIRHIRQIGIT